MKKLLFLFLSLLSSQAFAQENSFSINADTNAILIGQQLKLNLQAEIAVNSDYQWPLLPDTIKGLSLISESKIDSIIEGNRLKLSQEIIISSFDSGVVHIPQLSLLNGQDSLFSQGFIISVSLVPKVAETDLYDIKEPLEPPYNWWPLVYGIVASLIGLGLIYWLYKRFGRNAGTKPQEKIIVIPPCEWALGELQKLEDKELWQKGDQKQYFSELIDILRHFLEREFTLKAMESTAEELIDKLKKLEIEEEQLQGLSKALRLSSMVKFAKQQALDYENTAAMGAVKTFVESVQLKKEREAEEND